MNFLLDTDTLSLLQYSHPKVVQKVLALPAANIFLCAISL